MGDRKIVLTLPAEHGERQKKATPLYDMRKPINIFGAGATNNVVTGNFLGTNAAGTFAAPASDPSSAGVVLERGARRNRIGGAAAADRNVISGSGARGVFVNESDTDENLVENNIIGLAPRGDRALANRSHGIDLNSGGSNNVFRGNVLSGNLGSGIEISHFFGDTRGNRVLGNVIGRTRDGRPASNGPYGVQVDSRSVLTMLGPGNDIANNGVGVNVVGQATDANTITRNSIHDNAGLGIDLAPTGANLNDPGDADTGPNEQLNYPELQGVEPQRVSGTACGGCRVEVFADDGSGEGRQFLASGTADGRGFFDIATPNVPGGRTATATDGGGNTSEFTPPK